MPKGSKVLMADDDKMLLDMYKERLELAGYVVQSFYNGEDAITHVHDFQPDIVMLDVMMPKMNGYETLAALKSDPVTKGIPVIMLSALMRDFNREKAVEGGAEDYLIKSEAMPSDVITKIEQVLQKFGKGSTPPPGSASVGASSIAAVAAISSPPVNFAPPAVASSSYTSGEQSLSQPPSEKPLVESSTSTDFGSGEVSSNASGDISNKIFTTPPAEILDSNLETGNTVPAGENPEEKVPEVTSISQGAPVEADSSQKTETLVFAPSEENSPNLSPSAEVNSPDSGVAMVTQINQNQAPAPIEEESVPGSLNEVGEKLAKSNTAIYTIIVAIALLLVVGGIAFYFAFIKK